MKNTLIKIIVALGLISTPLALNAVESNNDFSAYGNDRIELLPVPTERAIPNVHDALIGTLVRIKLTVTEAGAATKIHASQPLSIVGGETEMEKDFLAELTDYVSGWDFEPAIDANGNPVAAKVIMPIRIIENNGEQLAQVMVMLDERRRNNLG